MFWQKEWQTVWLTACPFMASFMVVLERFYLAPAKAWLITGEVSARKRKKKPARRLYRPGFFW